MTDDLKRLMDEAAAAPPSTGVDAVAVLRSGRGRVRRRRALVGALASVTALVAAVAVAVPLSWSDPTVDHRSDRPDRAADTGEDDVAEQPLFELPEVTPRDGHTYEWTDDRDSYDRTEQTAAYGDAYVDQLVALFPELRIGDAAAMGPESFAPMDDDNRPTVFRQELDLVELDDQGRRTEVFAAGLPRYWTRTNLMVGDDDRYEEMELNVYAAGTFLPGEPAAGTPLNSGDTWKYLYRCTDLAAGPGGQQPVGRTNSCATDTAADGSTLITVTTDYFLDDNEEAGRELTVVHLRLDGTAVVVRDRAETFEPGRAFDPALSADELVTLVTTLPDATVE